jgi:hypothetical protein
VFTHYVERLYNDATAKVEHHGNEGAGTWKEPPSLINEL